MKSPNQFIVVPKNDRRYDNIKDIGGTQVILDSSENHILFQTVRLLFFPHRLIIKDPLKKVILF